MCAHERIPENGAKRRVNSPSHHVQLHKRVRWRRHEAEEPVADEAGDVPEGEGAEHERREGADAQPDDGRLREVMAGALVGARCPTMVGALRVCYLRYSSLRLGLDLTFSLLKRVREADHVSTS